jgi:hypothetical protein
MYSVLVFSSSPRFCNELEPVLESNLGVADGAGYCFDTGERDMEWMRKTKAGALKTFDAIRSRAKKAKIRVRVELVQHDE